MRQRQVLVNKNTRGGTEYYAPCLNCVKHPHYSQPPVTLHKGDRCHICLSLTTRQSNIVN